MTTEIYLLKLSTDKYAQLKRENNLFFKGPWQILFNGKFYPATNIKKGREDTIIPKEIKSLINCEILLFDNGTAKTYLPRITAIYFQVAP